MNQPPAPPGYLSLLPATACREAITNLHHERQQWINQTKKGFLRYRTPCEFLASFPARHVDCSGDTIIIGHPGELQHHGTQEQIRKALRAFMPWRKGPFSIFGIDVDAEWRSNRKWARLQPMLPNLEGKIIADIGCNNGYYMFRMAPFRPRLVLGLEPSMQHYYCFKALNHMARQDALHIDLLGVEHLSLFSDCFDVIFLMGIIYHRASPIDVLRDCYQALRPGGTLIVESQAIPGDEPIALFPDKTYAKVPGTYFVPTGYCLQLWMEKAGFSEPNLFSRHPMTTDEQRATDWMTFESYRDFIDPHNPSLTVEGYPAPLRIFLRGEKKL